MRNLIERNILAHVTGKKASVAMAWGTRGKVTWDRTGEVVNRLCMQGPTGPGTEFIFAEFHCFKQVSDNYNHSGCCG